MNDAQHDQVTKIMTSQGPYGTGVVPNPFWPQQNEVKRRHEHASIIAEITAKIESIFEPRFITPPETSGCIEALITMTDSRTILELGTCTGFTTLHMLRAVIGKPGAAVVSVDARPAHDAKFWGKPEFKETLTFHQGWTPGALANLRGPFSFVFVDSDHSLDHSQKEFDALLKLTAPGSIICWHDMPEWQTPDNRTNVPIRGWFNSLVKTGVLSGLILPTAEQMDCLQTYGPGYPKQCNPHLAIAIRN